MRVWEPDFKKNPFRDFVPSVDTILRVLAAQAGLLNSLVVEGIVSRFDQKVIQNPDSLLVDRLYLMREKPDRSDDSGWSIERLDLPRSEDPKWEATYVFKIAIVRLPMMAALALPYGYSCVLNGSRFEAVLDPSGNLVWEDLM